MVGFAVLLAAGTTAPVSPVSWVGWLEGLAALVTIIGGIIFLWRQGREQRSRNERFDRDWYGEDARPGVPARPGVMEQLQTVRTEVGQIRAEVFPNHGSSIKDQVTSMDLRLGTVEIDVRGIHQKLDQTTTTTTVTTVTAPDVHP